MNKFILLISSCFGLGYIKYAPGTFGSLGGVILWYFLVPADKTVQFACIVGIFLVSIFFSSLAERIYARKDAQQIVIDEVCGVWIALAFLPKTLFFLAAGFVLFRFFDIKKPFFIKKLQNFRGGFGVTIDDVAAGIFANLILQAVLLIPLYL